MIIMVIVVMIVALSRLRHGIPEIDGSPVDQIWMPLDVDFLPSTVRGTNGDDLRGGLVEFLKILLGGVRGIMSGCG